MGGGRQRGRRGGRWKEEDRKFLRTRIIPREMLEILCLDSLTEVEADVQRQVTVEIADVLIVIHRPRIEFNCRH